MRAPAPGGAHAVICALLVATVLAAAPTPAAGAASLKSRLTGILTSSGLGGSGAAVCVYDRTEARFIYTRNTTRLLIPASNTKLTTTAAAITHWEPTHRIPTDLYFSQPPVYGGERLIGDIYLKGHGDPGFGTEEYRRKRLHYRTGTVQQFVTYLKRLGIRKISGHVVGDESWFDRKRVCGSWKSGLAAYCAPLSALSFNGNYFKGRRVSEPALHAARRFTQILERNGIDVVGGPRAGRTPGTALLAKRVYSAPMSVLIRRTNVPSDNFFAEMLTKGMGKDFRDAGTTAGGLRVTRATMQALGLPPSSYRLWDGSGLSYWNRLTAGGVNRLLRSMRKREEWSVYLASFAVAGRTGTLRTRMRRTAAEGNFRGKTGTLAVSSCLSGRVTSANGHEIVVSILMNGHPLNTWNARVAQDRIIVALAKARP